MVTRLRWWTSALVLAGWALGWSRLATPIAAQRPPDPGGSAGHVNVGASAGTLGAGASVAVSLGERVALRTGFNFFAATFDETFDGIPYDARPRLESVPLLVDVRPGRGGFHLTGGILLNRNELQARARIGGGAFIGGRLYGQDEVPSLSGRIASRRTAPYVGIGFGGMPGGSGREAGRVSMAIELGVVAHGRPRAELTGVTTLTGEARELFDRNVAAEQAELQQELDRLPAVIGLYPVLNLGVTVGVR
jgi:hypothetical protein